MVHSGDSRLAAGYFDSSAWGNDTGYTNFNDSPIANALEGCSYSWVFSPTCLVSAIQQMGFGVNSLNFNYGQSGCGIQNALNAYALGCVTTTGNITAGSATITITGGTSGLSGTMIVEGPGIPPGIWCNTSTGALSDGVVGGSFTTARKPSVTTTGATLVFIPQSEATAFSANSYITTANEPVPHQLSPAVSGPAGSIFFIESAINDDYAWTSSATLSTSTKTVTGVTLPTNYLIPVGYGISGTGIPSGATVVSNTQTTITYTASSNSTVSGSETITVTPVLSAWETQAASLISLALADSWNVVIETPEKSWATPWSTGESFRQSMVAWEKATYGGAAFGGSTVTGVTVVDVAGMGIFGSNDKTIYQDGTHLTPRANALVANFLEQQLGPLFSSGPPQTMGGPGSIALDWLQRELGSLSLGPRPDGQSVLLYAYSGGNSSAICLGAPGNGPNFSWSESPKEFFFNSWIGFPMAVNGSTSVNATVPAIPNTQTTSVTGSTSGTAVFSEPFYQPGYKKVMIVCSSLVGTASYTFPTAFTTTPVALATSGPATSVVTSLSTTAVTVTGATTTGALILEGY